MDRHRLGGEWDQKRQVVQKVEGKIFNLVEQRASSGTLLALQQHRHVLLVQLKDNDPSHPHCPWLMVHPYAHQSMHMLSPLSNIFSFLFFFGCKDHRIWVNSWRIIVTIRFHWSSWMLLKANKINWETFHWNFLGIKLYIDLIIWIHQALSYVLLILSLHKLVHWFF